MYFMSSFHFLFFLFFGFLSSSSSSLSYLFLVLSSFKCLFIYSNFVNLTFLVSAQEWKSCSVGCHFGFNANKKPDAAFGLPQQSGTAGVLRSMESSHYYSENNIAQARRWVSTNWNWLAENFIMAVVHIDLNWITVLIILAWLILSYRPILAC